MWAVIGVLGIKALTTRYFVSRGSIRDCLDKRAKVKEGFVLDHLTNDIELQRSDSGNQNLVLRSTDFVHNGSEAVPGVTENCVNDPVRCMGFKPIPFDRPATLPINCCTGISGPPAFQYPTPDYHIMRHTLERMIRSAATTDT